MSDAVALDAVCLAVPFGWQAAPPGEVDVLYSLCVAPPSQRQEQRNEHLLYCGSALIARAAEYGAILVAFTRHAELLTATRARNSLFVHAGVVGWRGQAILVPGRSFSGKTTLVKALVEAGATYYSDEFAILDHHGQVHPYPLPLSLRDGAGQSAGPLPIAALGGQAGTEPIPIGLVIVTQYQAGAKWRPRPLSAAQTLLALMDNTVAARREPSYTMPILRAAVANTTTITSKRGEAGHVAQAILRRFTA